jgi:hypothetical protein
MNAKAAMTAFHDNPAIKAKYLARLAAHEAADEIIHGKYWENGKGCAVGCTIHGSDHEKYESELGIPQGLARLEDSLFEGQPKGEAKTFPRRFLEAAKPGADLSRVQWLFLHWLLTEGVAGRDHPLVRDVIKQCANVLVPLAKGEKVDESAARSAARSAESAAWSAACSAESAAKSAARSAESAAWSAAWSAASAAWSAATSAAYKRMADKLLILIAEA